MLCRRWTTMQLCSCGFIATMQFIRTSRSCTQGLCLMSGRSCGSSWPRDGQRMLPGFGVRFWRCSITPPRRTSSTTCLQASSRSGRSPALSPTAFAAARDAAGSRCHLSEPTVALQSLFGPGLPRLRHGPNIMPVRPASLRCRWLGLLRACGPPISSRTTPRPWWQELLSRPTRGQCRRPSFGSSGGSGTMGSDVGRSPVSQQSRLTPRPVGTTEPGPIERCGCSWGPWRRTWTCSRLRVGAVGSPLSWCAGAAPQQFAVIACHVATGVCDSGSAGVLVQASCTSSAGWRPQRARSFIRGGTPKQGWAVGNRTLAQFQQCPMVFSSVVSYQGRPAVGNRCAARFVCRLAIITLCQFRGAGWRRLCGPWAERCSRASLLLRDGGRGGVVSSYVPAGHCCEQGARVASEAPCAEGCRLRLLFHRL